MDADKPKCRWLQDTDPHCPAGRGNRGRQPADAVRAPSNGRASQLLPAVWAVSPCDSQAFTKWQPTFPETVRKLCWGLHTRDDILWPA